MPKMRHGSIVIGIGNPDRGDDGAGPAAARWLHGRLPTEIQILEHGGEATSLLACLERVASAYLIDACALGAPAGTVRRFDAGAAALPGAAFNLSSHGLGLAEAIEVARALGQLPSRCIVYAIEATAFEPGLALSPAVTEAIAEAGKRVRDEICGADLRHGKSVHEDRLGPT